MDADTYHHHRCCYIMVCLGDVLCCCRFSFKSYGKKNKNNMYENDDAFRDDKFIVL